MPGRRGVGPAFALHCAVERSRALARPARHQYWPQWAAFAWLAVGLLTLLGAGACSRGIAAGRNDGSGEAHATITGSVRGFQSGIGGAGRTVDVVNLDTNERHRLTTDQAGAFVLTVMPGKYRVELALRDGESLMQAPGVVSVGRSASDAHADFVVGPHRASRPRGPAYRTDDGLGSPIA